MDGKETHALREADSSRHAQGKPDPVMDADLGLSLHATLHCQYDPSQDECTGEHQS